VRTTIRLDDELLSAAKQHAITTGRTLTAVIEDALRQALARSASGRPARRVALPIARGGGRLQPGLDDSAALLELMETTDASR
jgi:hypothetical protein